MKRCKRCRRLNTPLHSCITKKYRSTCCHAKVFATGNLFRFDMDNPKHDKDLEYLNFHIECDKCKKACHIL